MNIIIEGCDGAGKSTLATFLQRGLGMGVQGSEGPGRSETEINQRVERYAEYTDTIFDRHPCVSQLIYNKFREGPKITLPNMQLFLKRLPKTMVIYCADADFDAQQFKSHDTPEHINMMRDNFDYLVEQYEDWAIMYANIIYRKNHYTEQLLHMIEAFEEYNYV